MSITPWTIRFRRGAPQCYRIRSYLCYRVFPTERACRRFLKRHRRFFGSSRELVEPVALSRPASATGERGVTDG